jgi:lipoic acid synthetase
MKVRAPSKDGSYFDVQRLVHGLSLHTICEEARCPNISECWGRGTATFQILGDTCTRACRYCYVQSGKPEAPPDPLEPLRLAQAAAQMQLKHVVVTSVDRDDVPGSRRRPLRGDDPRAEEEAARSLRRGADARLPRGRGGGAPDVLAARPEVFNHNIETVRRLHARMRGAKASYDRRALAAAPGEGDCRLSRPDEVGIIVGLGETNDEVVETMRDLRRTASTSSRSASTCSRARSTRTIDRWVHPDEFRWFREQGEALGFGSVFSGRSCARATARTSRSTRQRRAAARSPTRAEGPPGGGPSLTPLRGCD